MSEWAEHDQASLVAAEAGGDAAAFGVLYRRHLSVVLRWCLRETGNREVAADLSAEVFTAALTSVHRFRASQDTVFAWLLGNVVDERPYEQIASELRCSESVVRQRVSRALRTLRSQMEER
jgi:DNA-directed RNA polymerase specialized sigma24 family protein